MTIFQPPTLWPFEPDTAVYCVQYDKQSEPPLRIPAVVLWVRGTRASVQRADKTRITSTRLRRLALRGYCAVCPAPAMIIAGQLVCSKCQAPAVDAPPPDDLVLRWFPLAEYHSGLLMRRSFEHPGWSYTAVSHAAVDTMQHAYAEMLERLGLPWLYVSGNGQTAREEYRLFELMHLYAAMNDDRAFLATYRDLSRLQACPAPPRSDRRPLVVDWEDSFLLHLMDRRPPEEEEETHARPVDDQPDTDHSTDLDRWLDEQFRRAA